MRTAIRTDSSFSMPKRRKTAHEKVLRSLFALLLLTLCMTLLTGCRQSSRVSHNVSKETK